MQKLPLLDMDRGVLNIDLFVYCVMLPQGGIAAAAATRGLSGRLDYHIKCNTAPKKERHCVRFVLE